MKEKVIYGTPFVFTFILVSVAIIYLNSSFKNIFKFDFSPITHVSLPQEAAKTKQETKVDSTQAPQSQDSTKQNNVQPPIDTVAVANTTKSNDAKNENTGAVKKAETKNPIPLFQQKKIVDTEQLNKTEPESIPVQTELVAQKEKSDYKNWVKQTVKLYESMETKKAAKIIQGYSDNIARDILFTMKKKKAAEILAEFKPEVVTRIISVN
jgi:flagellar motility protein MotE (MotC chaperone)